MVSHVWEFLGGPVAWLTAGAVCFVASPDDLHPWRRRSAGFLETLLGRVAMRR